MSSRALVLIALASACAAPGTDDVGDTDSEPSPLFDLEASAAWSIPGLGADAHVVYGPMGVPWVYAEDRADLGRVVGFVLARDRLFYMELARRLAQGRISELLGGAGLETDLESRSTGMTAIVDRVESLVGDDPEMAAYFDGVAEGVNAAIAEMKAGRLPPPSELGFAGGLLGAAAPADLLEPFTRRDVAAGLVTVLYESGFETKDVGRAADAERLATAGVGAPFEALRRAGLLEDVWNDPRPVHPVASAPDWLVANPPERAAVERRGSGPRVAPGVLSRLRRQLDRVERRFGHDWVSGFGSNAWAVSADKSADGRALLASDGHLQLSVPPLFYQIGVDTRHLGGGDVHQVGLMTPAMPLLSTGTNGDVAFGQTQLIGDITDWYREILVLDGDGLPVASRFDGEDRPLLAYTETIQVKVVGPPLGDGTGGPFTFARYTTFDGRWIASIEGDDLGAFDVEVEQPAVLVGGRWIRPRDVDGGGISAVSFDYAGLDLSNMASAIDRYNRAEDVLGFAEATRDLVAYSLNLVAADKEGAILYTGFQAVPCRGYLDRESDGTWAEGADPNLLIDGTRYPGFTIPITAGRVDFTQGADPTRCVIPWEEYPHAFTPEQGFVVTANNDPGGLTFDGSITNDRHYIGGPWMEGYRADAIQRRLLEDVADDGGVTVDEMKAGQGNHESTLGRQLVPFLLESLDAAAALAEAGSPADDAAARTVALQEANAERFAEAADRLRAWQESGFVAHSGVETFYDAVTEEERAAAVATMIHNAWMGRFVGFVVGDEDLPGLGWPTGDTGRFRVVTQAIEGRGPGNPLDLGAWNPDTEEPIWFDIRATPELESSTEVALLALRDALDFLASASTDDGAEGGFGTEDMDAWLWGLRHRARMTSLIGDFLGDDSLSFLTEPFNITPTVLPLAEGLGRDDPRAALDSFPRPGDHLGVDALNSGTGGTRFTAGSGSVMRLVVALGGEKGFEAYNVIPGGQSGLIDSPHFADQARLWLANDYLPVWLDVGDVVSNGERREVFRAP